MIVVVVVSTEDEVVVMRGTSGYDEVGNSEDVDEAIEVSGIVGIVISVVWPIPEPAVAWAVADVVSWKRATIVGDLFSRFGVVWGTFSLGALVVVSMTGIVVDVSENWLVVTPVSSIELTSCCAVVVIDDAVGWRVSLSALSVIKDAN